MNWGNRWGRKMEWGGNGEGEVSLQATWDQGGQGSHHTERREFQVSKGDSEQGELSRGVSRGNWQGELAEGIGKGN